MTAERRRVVMASVNEALVRAAYEAVVAGDLDAYLSVFSTELEWTYLDPTVPDPVPQICYGRDELRHGVQRQLSRGLTGELEEVIANDDRVLVVVHIPGLDRFRARSSNDRQYQVLTVRQGEIQALRACRDLPEARSVAGLS